MADFLACAGARPAVLRTFRAKYIYGCMRKILHFAKPKQARINGLPVMSATVTDEEDGMLRISLVDWPAVESDFRTFHKDTPKAQAPGMYRVVNEERRIVYGVVMRADFPIYRYDEHNGEYFIVFSAETVRTLAEKYLAEGRQNNVNVMHLAGSDVEGVRMVQFFLKDVAAGVNPAGFECIEDGSLFAEFHVENDEVWKAIKEGTYRGFSIEVITGLEPAPAEDFAVQVRNIVNDSNLTDMFKLSKIKALARKALGKFRSVNTDKGVLQWDGDEDAKVGTKVFVPGEGEDAEPQPAPDGDYTLEDGVIYRVADGEIAEIVEAPAGDPEPDNHEGEGDPAPSGDEDPNADPEPSAEERIAALEEEVEGLEEVLETIITRLAELGVDIESLKRTPAADPAKKRFRDQKPAAAKQTGIARLKSLLG